MRVCELMKNLSLRIIIPVIEGYLLRGKVDFIINHVANLKNNKFTNNTLVFYRKNMKIPINLKSCVIVTSEKEVISKFPMSYTIIYVNEVSQAYWRFIDFYRSMFDIPVVGITGTCGKTTTKEMISHILAPEMNVVKTIMSQNGLANNIKYLLQINENTDAAVIEMGVNTTGHIFHTARFFKPTIGIITTIGTDHLEGFTNHDAYILEKESMLTAVNSKGTMILNADDHYTTKLDKNKFQGKFIYIGEADHSDFKIEKVKYYQNGMRYMVKYKNEIYFGFVPGFGKHNVYDAVFAIAAANLLGISVTTAIERLNTFTPVIRHLQLHKGINGSTIIDDTWNTNPTSIKAALEVLAELSKGKNSIAILGDIEELGDYSKQEHEKIGEMVINYKIDYLITIGDKANEIAAKARELGMSSSKIYKGVSEFYFMNLLKKIANRHTTILVKTSMRKSFRNLMLKMKGSKMG